MIGTVILASLPRSGASLTSLPTSPRPSICVPRPRPSVPNVLQVERALEELRQQIAQLQADMKNARGDTALNFERPACPARCAPLLLLLSWFTKSSQGHEQAK